MKRLACGLALLPAAAAALACPLKPADGALVQQGAVQLAWRTDPAAIVNGQPFVMHVALCPAAATLLRVDATMPEHRHGMNYRPTLKPQGPGAWRVDGLLWHMAGRWELRWDVQLEGRTEVLRASVTLR
jgi:hypothetical protein